MTDSVLPTWTHDLRAQLPAWLSRLRLGGSGCYRLCSEGDLLQPTPGAGLGLSCYAAKIAVQFGLWPELQADERAAWTHRIQGFQLSPRASTPGLFLDPWVEQHLSSRSARHRAKLALTGRWTSLRRTFGPDRELRWAETRQAISTLKAVGAEPRCRTFDVMTDPTLIARFLETLDWSRPWAAGAQTGHLLFFLRQAQRPEPERQAALQAVLGFLQSVHCNCCGGWHRGRVSTVDVLNGAMKITAGLAWWSRPLESPEPLLATALSDIKADYDCGHTNRLFVLHRLSCQMPLPGDHVREVARRALKSLDPFRQADGAFSSSTGGSLTHYYGARVSEGRRVSDLHGTCLLTWAIVLAADLCGEREPNGFALIAP